MPGSGLTLSSVGSGSQLGLGATSTNNDIDEKKALTKHVMTEITKH